MKEQYVAKKFSEKHEAVIEWANHIIDEYAPHGITLTLRQLYYQFVARDVFANVQRNYRLLSSVISDARLAGRVDWDAIEDRTRETKENPHWDDPADMIDTARKQYRRDLWEDQPERVEVWIEKDALLSVIETTCRDLDVPYFACRGYASQSALWRAGKRMLHRSSPTTVLHFGDHDPSGIDMTRDNKERLRMFSEGNSRVIRVALNRDQVDEYGPPPNPAKMTDPRAGWYLDEHGSESWELDALDPLVIQALVRDRVTDHMIVELWEEKRDEQEAERATLEQISERYDDVVGFLEDG